MGLFLFSQPLPQKKTHQLKKKQTRLAKYYVPLDDASKRALEYDVHRLTAGRDSKLSNVVEVRRKIRRKREENDDDRNEEKTHHLFLSPPKKTLKKRNSNPQPTVQDLQDHLPPIRGPLLLPRLRPLRQRARAARGRAPLRRSPRPLFWQRLRARPRVQLPPRVLDPGRVYCRGRSGAVEQEGDPGEAGGAGQDRDVRNKGREGKR